MNTEPTLNGETRGTILGNSFPEELYEPLYRALHNDAENAEKVIGATLPDSLRHLLRGGPVQHVRIHNASDPHGQTFIGGVFEIGRFKDRPRGACVLMRSSKWDDEERRRMEGYLQSVGLHYTEQDITPVIVPMVFQIPDAD